MRKFAIITDSTSDLAKPFREKYDIECIQNRFFYKDVEYSADPDWTALPIKEFYDYLRAGNRITTSQISVSACTETFEKCLKEGYDILSISCTSALSSTVNVCYRVRDELQQKYPEQKIICIDSSISSAGLGILCIRASELRAQGKTLEETADWVEKNKLFINQEGTVEDLNYLKRAGRVSAASAFFGGLFNIKPLIISDVHGYNVAIEKVKGRKTSLMRTVERVVENFTNQDYPDIFIHHTDCEADALFIRDELVKKLNMKEENFHIGNINAAIGASVGPGMIGVYFYGKEVTYDSKVK